MITAKHGIDDPATLDAEAWEDWLERLARVNRKKLDLEGRRIEVIQEDLLKIATVLTPILRISHSGIELSQDGTMIIHTTQCDLWEGIKKAGFAQYAKAGLLVEIYTRQHIRG